MPNQIRDQLTKYISDAHAIEEQSLAQLRRAPDIAGETGLARELRTHLNETERHEREVRRLLEARGGKPSGFKEAIMRLGGKGFVLFAESQPDTPGKLAAHALSYEALEWAAYDLLARTADRAGEADVASVARSIRDEERAMMDRIEALFDDTVEASLRQMTDKDLDEHLNDYLADAHAIEGQSIQLLESGKKMVEADSAFARLFDEHLAESREQQQLLERRLDGRGGKRSILKDAAMRFGALEWGAFFGAHPDTGGKLPAFAYAFEHLEIGGYEQLRRTADRAGDTATANLARQILTQERTAAEKIAAAFEDAVESALAEQGVA